MNKTKFVVKGYDETKIIDILNDVLAGRRFDFNYQLFKSGQTFSQFNQLLRNDLLKPIKHEKRGKVDCLVLLTEGEDEDPIISIPEFGGMLTLDLRKFDQGLVIITNSLEERYTFKINR